MISYRPSNRAIFWLIAVLAVALFLHLKDRQLNLKPAAKATHRLLEARLVRCAAMLQPCESRYSDIQVSWTPNNASQNTWNVKVSLGKTFSQPPLSVVARIVDTAKPGTEKKYPLLATRDVKSGNVPVAGAMRYQASIPIPGKVDTRDGINAEVYVVTKKEYYSMRFFWADNR